MLKYTTTFLLLFLIVFPWQVYSQPRPRVLTSSNQQFTYRNYQMPGPRIELGFSAGGVFPFTDVAPGEPDMQPALTDFRFESVDLNGALFARYRFNDLYGLKGSFSYVRLKGDDFWAASDAVRERGRSFSNNLFELAAVGEFYLPKKRGNIVRNAWMDFILYGGIAAVYHDPKVFGPIIDDYDRAQQNDPFAYKNLVMVFPTGIMVQYNYLNHFTIGLDMNFRWTLTDFLDGFDRPAKQRSDYYMTTNLSFSYIISHSPRKSNSLLSRKVFKRKRSGAGSLGFF